MLHIIAGSVILLKLLCFTRGTNKYQEKVRIHTGKHQARAQSKNIDCMLTVTTIQTLQVFRCRVDFYLVHCHVCN